MGQDAVDIIQREYAYAARGEPVIQIRAGTAGGLNTRNLYPPIMKLGDMVIVDRNIGRSGAIEQALGYFAKVIPDENSAKELELFLKEAEKYGIVPAFGGRFYANKNDRVVTAALEQSAKGLKYRYYIGANFTKESLNAESVDDVFLSLREKENVLVSEMEQLTNAFTAAFTRIRYGVSILTGMIVESIGGVPGPGFPDRNDKKQMKLQEKVEGDTLLIAAESLVYLAKMKPPE
jgi:nucleoside phosphorylase